ncbi:hypothetical protein AB0K60_13255 [Thermopolyspora sp. NPDC052614]|uniref:hypothetical protein n=1 Tax=Thermopolyspora sp. NPDC052614 TaxID=3155682 RepID=UPI003446F458
MTFTQAIPDRPLPDPTKHVNYVHGMVLGVGDFTQEFAYLSGRDRSLARAIGGYGTVEGLRVAYEAANAGHGPRVTVAPGAAFTPAGRLVRVPVAQCADLVEWLAAHRDDVVAALGGPPPASGTLRLAVVLGYAECLTDQVPVPGEPCRGDEDLTAPSRLRDDFRLELRFAPPPPGRDLPSPPAHDEETAIRRFAAWLRRVPVDAGAGGTVADFLDAIRTAAHQPAPDSPPAPGCPPADTFLSQPPPPELRIPEDRAAEFLRAAFRLWVTELLPCFRTEDPDDDGVLLARLDVDVLHDPLGERELLVGPGGVTVDEQERPFLVQSRLVQEWQIARYAP